MKHTREEIKRRNEPRNVQVFRITDPEEVARSKAECALDNGPTMVVEDALYAIAEGAKRGRNLLDVVARLATHLTPEQQLGLAERLPDLLSMEARAVRAARLADAARG